MIEKAESPRELLLSLRGLSPKALENTIIDWIARGAEPRAGIAVGLLKRMGAEPMSYLIRAALAPRVTTAARIKCLQAAAVLRGELSAESFFDLQASAHRFGESVRNQIRGLLLTKVAQRATQALGDSLS